MRILLCITLAIGCTQPATGDREFSSTANPAVKPMPVDVRQPQADDASPDGEGQQPQADASPDVEGGQPQADASPDGAEAGHPSASPALHPPKPRQELAGDYPWRLSYLPQNEVNRLARNYTSTNPDWNVTVDRFGNIQSIESKKWREQERKLLAAGFDPKWESSADVPAFYRELVASFVRKNWQSLGLPKQPKKGLGLGVTFFYMRTPDLQMRGSDPYWVAVLKAGVRSPKRLPKQFSRAKLSKKVGTGTYRAQLKTCSPCNAGNPSACVCRVEILLEGAAKIYSVSVAPQAFIKDSGIEVRLVASPVISTPKYMQEIRKLRQRALTKLKKMGRLNPSSAPLGVSFQKPAIWDAVTGESLEALLGMATYPLLPARWSKKEVGLVLRGRSHPKYPFDATDPKLITLKSKEILELLNAPEKGDYRKTFSAIYLKEQSVRSTRGWLGLIHTQFGVCASHRLEKDYGVGQFRVILKCDKKDVDVLLTVDRATGLLTKLRFR